VTPVLLLSFGGPEAPDEILPFLRRVTAGRGIPDARLERVAGQYRHFGGVSPLPEACRALADSLPVPTYLGNLYSAPFVDDAFAAMEADGVTACDVLVTSSYGADASCRRYGDTLRGRAVQTRRLPLVAAWPGFAEAWRSVIPDDDRRVVFTAHSLPTDMAARSPYEASIRTSCAAIGEGRTWTLAWQSRSGSPAQPWLGPDVGEVVRDGDVVVPIGFPLANLEIEWDLAVQAAEVADLEVVRPPALGPLAAAAIASGIRLPEACSSACCELA